LGADQRINHKPKNAATNVITAISSTQEPSLPRTANIRYGLMPTAADAQLLIFASRMTCLQKKRTNCLH
jgi:hypothetical protein